MSCSKNNGGARHGPDLRSLKAGIGHPQLQVLRNVENRLSTYAAIAKNKR